MAPRNPFLSTVFPLKDQCVQVTTWCGRPISFFSVSLAAMPSQLGEIGDEEESGPGLREI